MAQFSQAAKLQLSQLRIWRGATRRFMDTLRPGLPIGSYTLTVGRQAA